jgi:hypothetical protein
LRIDEEQIKPVILSEAKDPDEAISTTEVARRSPDAAGRAKRFLDAISEQQAAAGSFASG